MSDFGFVAGDLQQSQLWDEVRRLNDQTSATLATLRTDVDAASTYTVADATDWTGTAPTTIAEALDRIAAALAGLGAPP